MPDFQLPRQDSADYRFWARLALKQSEHKMGRPDCGLKETLSGLPH